MTTDWRFAYGIGLLVGLLMLAIVAPIPVAGFMWATGLGVHNDFLCNHDRGCRTAPWVSQP